MALKLTNGGARVIARQIEMNFRQNPKYLVRDFRIAERHGTRGVAMIAL